MIVCLDGEVWMGGCFDINDVIFFSNGTKVNKEETKVVGGRWEMMEYEYERESSI
jgi:hypothetical protein